MSIRILLVDDEELVRAGFRLILESELDLEVVGEAGNGIEAVELTRKLDPDVVLMDIQMPVMNGLEATREIAALGRSETSRVLILTTFELDEYVYEALRAGASGFLLKRTPAADLASLRQRGDAGRPDHGRAEQVAAPVRVLLRYRLARVQADADANRLTACAVLSKRPLHGDGAFQRLHRRAE